MRKLFPVFAILVIVGFMTATVSFGAVEKGPYLVWNGDNTTMTVLWQFSSTQGSSIEWGTTTSYELDSADTSEYGSDHQHIYTITGLTPGQKYYYNVSGVGSGSFTAAPSSSATNVKIFAYGDTRSYPDEQDMVCGQMINSYSVDPLKQTLCINSGDWVNDGRKEADWQDQFFSRSHSNLLQFQSEIALCGPRGNHEYDGILFNKYFPQPWENNYYYSFDYGPVHVVVVDQYTNYNQGSAQYNWIESDLAASNKTWKIMTFHEPAWSAGTHENSSNAQSYLHPLCVQYGVDIVLCGHNHYYARAVVDDVHHITTGGGGAPLYSVNTHAEGVVTAIKDYNFCEININGGTLTFTAKRGNGNVIETFQINHTPPSPSVTITSPTEGASIEAGDSTTISASVEEAGGTCSKVSFYEDGDLIDEDYSGPYSVSWTTPTVAGNVALTAEAEVDMGSSVEYPVSDHVNVTITEPYNDPPVAEAGNNQTVVDVDEDDYQTVTLDGSGSYDPDGSIVSWTWKENTSTIGTAEVISPSLVVGEHTITLVVQDDEGATDTDTVTITVQSYVNQEPIAEAGQDQTVTDSDDNGYETITLDGSDSFDPDGFIDKWEWDIDNNGTYDDLIGNIVNHDFDLGTHIVTLRVTDDDGAIHTDQVLITVNEPTPDIDFKATGESTVRGTITGGDYTYTQASDNTYEKITEELKAGRWSILDHTWTFNITGNASVVFMVEAFHSKNSEGDDFVFAYSTDNVVFNNMFTVTKIADGDTYQSFELPLYTSGTIYVRVTDTDQTKTNIELDTLYVDNMFIRTSGNIQAPGAAFSPVPADGAINVAVDTLLTWSAGAGAEGHDLYIWTDEEYFSQISLDLNTTSYDPGGLEEDTIYYWRVDEGNSAGTTTGSEWSFTTTGGDCETISVDSIVKELLRGSKGQSFGQATVTLLDNCGNPVSGADVTGHFTGDFSGDLSNNEEMQPLTSDDNGQAVFKTVDEIKKPVFDFEVDTVSANGLTWIP